MSIELLDADLIDTKLREQGRTRKWIIEQLDLGGDGYKILRGEWLPKNGARKAQIVRGVAKLIGVEVPQILLRLKADKKAS